MGVVYTGMVALLYTALAILITLSHSHSLTQAVRSEDVERSKKEDQSDVKMNTARMMGLDTGNPAADHEAGMWIAALIGTLVSAIPVAFLSPSLGFKKRKRSVDMDMVDMDMVDMDMVNMDKVNRVLMEVENRELVEDRV